MKNLTAKISAGNALILEQTSILSTAYALKGDVDIITDIGQYTLKHGERLMLDASDISNVSTRLAEKATSIDEAISTYAIFTRNNGKELLMQNEEPEA